MKKPTTPKTIRIPNDTIADIEKEASAKNISFTDVAIGRLNNSGMTLSPMLLAKVQDVLNLARKGAETGSMEMIEKAQEEENELWKKIGIL